MTSEKRSPEPSAAAEGKANGERPRVDARAEAEIRARQRSLMNAMLCCMI